MENKQKRKICVVMWYNEKIKEFAELCYNINKMYCNKYGYTIIKSCKERSKEKNKTFEKFPLILKYLKKYDYVIWIDADAHFFLDSGDISELINIFPDKDFILSGDKDLGKQNCIPIKNTFITERSEINAGVIIVKNTKYAKETLKHWIQSESLMERRHGKYTLYNLPKFIYQKQMGDQGIIRLYYYENINNFCNHSTIIPLGIIQTFSFEKMIQYYLKYPFLIPRKKFIIHYAGVSNNIRISKIKHYYQKYCNLKTKIERKNIIFSD